MGEAELQRSGNSLIIHAVINIYGDAANDALAVQVAKDIADFWNQAEGTVTIRQNWFTKKIWNVQFNITGKYMADLSPEDIYGNTDPRNNYFRIEAYANGNISFVDGLNSNTGYFLLSNLVDNSSTAAHEFGHTLGLGHPHQLDIRGMGTPGIMYPRGTLVDPQFQYYPDVAPGEKGGTLNPYTRRVLQSDIDDLNLHQLGFNEKGFAVIGGFSSVWHEKHQPPVD
jgi:hypothetical protein